VPGDLDTLLAAGEVVWCGVEPLGERDGKIALYLSDHLSRLWHAPTVTLDERETQIFGYLQARGASFFAAIHQAVGDGFAGDTTEALWNLVWKGVVTNDTFRPVRDRVRAATKQSRREAVVMRGFRMRRAHSAVAEGRWSLVATRVVQPVSETERAVALAEQLLTRYGVVSREVASAEGISGGFSAIYDVLKTLEESGRIRRGYFVSGVGATQFALPQVLEQLRGLRVLPDAAEVAHLAATDPANPYGALLKWPAGEGRALARSVGATVILVDGALAGYLTKGGRQLVAFLPDGDPEQTRMAQALAARLKLLASEPMRRGLLLSEVNGAPVDDSALAPYLRDAGFVASYHGFYLEPVLKIVERERSAARTPGAPGVFLV
jgi:ATP-dependent helicase Lhr and Lhr-like helicase